MQLVYAYHETTPTMKYYYTDEKINFIVDNELKVNLNNFKWKWDLLPQ